ncbi:purine and uridine phosphorylase [Periconia macrospinosa]|uniref:Purine and uridine phosphorylase n=1 Tax=Periconia macrospinosa TaxID=97972 RepID=A0A2V1E207_9PLEO|nr:purine and uridine phosphorylase [Periconia macrospinosa]
MDIRRPFQRDEFEIAIICALPLEFDALCLLLDERWDEDGDQYGRAAGDNNIYHTGRIGKHPVVIVLLSAAGKAHAAGTSASMRSSYAGLRLTLLVGICGGVPSSHQYGEVFLGDVIISKSIVQYDIGSQYPHAFIRKNDITSSMSMPSKEVRNLLVTLETDYGRDWLLEKSTNFLDDLYANAALRKRESIYEHPGPADDKLFEATYHHKHHKSSGHICNKCDEGHDSICEEALELTCEDLKCEGQYLVNRTRSEMQESTEADLGTQASNFSIHTGTFASGDKQMRSAQHRDIVAKKENVIAFETEGAGVWDELPCIIVKGVYNYADSHESEKWQNFAAATAASTAKALLLRYIQTDKKLVKYDFISCSDASPTSEASVDPASTHQHVLMGAPDKTLPESSGEGVEDNSFSRRGRFPRFRHRREKQPVPQR